ncbi:hypothetical protein EI555_011346 [Monodon monoceros]|nr:hypothetical protein EI555_011346 [Monodon monoceros]
MLLRKRQHPAQLRIHARTLCGTAIHELDVPEQGGASSRKKGAGAGGGPRPPKYRPLASSLPDAFRRTRVPCSLQARGGGA